MQEMFVIEGMGCQRCVKKVEQALSELPGVSEARVTLAPPREPLSRPSEWSPRKKLMQR